MYYFVYSISVFFKLKLKLSQIWRLMEKRLKLFLIQPFQIILNINCGNNIVKYEKSLR